MSKACTECNCIKANGVDFFCEVASVCVPNEVALDPEGECQYFKQRTGPTPFEVVILRECLKINPDNPQAVAEAIPLLWELAWEAVKYNPKFLPKLVEMGTEAIHKAKTESK